MRLINLILKGNKNKTKNCFFGLQTISILFEITYLQIVVKFLMNKITFFRIILVFFCFLKMEASFSQILISGQLSEKSTKIPIQNANITIKKINSKAILFFGFSDKKGNFLIESNIDSDSVQLHIGIMGYAPLVLNLLNYSQRLDLQLEQAVIELKELNIKQEPIRKFGDTLSYAIGEFKDKNDRVLADVLKRLPGIEVEPNGRILYQGEPINKYYIEGLDLLNGRYKLANDNLNIDAVQSVEVLENHQPIRMLDSTVFSDKAAINIRLKKAVTNSGQINLGLGSTPLLWDINLTPMLFSKKLQMISTFQGNNTGKNSSSQLMQLTPGTVFSDLEARNSDWVGIQQLSSPAFKEIRWLDNNVKIGSMNFLKKLKDGLELRFISDFSSDIQLQNGSTKTTFFDSDKENIQLLETKRNRLGFNSSKTSLTIQKNTNDRYLKNSLKINGIWNNQLGNIIGVNGGLKQQTKLPVFIISNSYQDFFKINKTILTLNSSSGFENVNQSLSISPSIFIELFGLSKATESVQQNVQKDKMFTQNSIQFIKKVKKISVETSVGFDLNKEILRSGIALDFPNERTVLGQDFNNNLKWSEQKYYVKLINRLNHQEWKIAITTPISFNSFFALDGDFKKQQTLKTFVFEPRISLNREIKNFWTFNINMGKSNRFGDINQMYFGYILNNYRDIKRFNAPVLQSVNYSGNIGLNYRNPVKSTFGSVSFANGKTISNLIYTNIINTNGSIERNALEKNNEGFSQNWNGRIGKYFRIIKTTFTVRNSVFSQKGVQVINENETLVKTQGMKPSIDVTSTLSPWFSFYYNYSFSSFRNKVGREIRPNVVQESQFLNLNCFTKNNFNFSVNNEIYINNFNNQKNIFTDFSLRKTIGKRKIDLEANYTNIFNSNTLLTVSSGTFSYIETAYLLRPRQAVFKIRFSY